MTVVSLAAAPAGSDPPHATPNGAPIFFMTQPVWTVRERAIASYRLRAITPRSSGEAESNSVTTRELIDLDLQVLDHALQLLTRSAARFGLYVPLHIRTLNSIPGRQAVLTRLHRSATGTTTSLIACLEGMDAGAPRVVLDTAVGGLRPLCLGVVGRAPSLSMDLAAWRDVRLSAVSFDFNDLTGADDAELPRTLSRFAELAKTISPTLIGDSLTTRAQVIAAGAAGFTHISGDILGAPPGPPFTPVRFEPANLDLESSTPGPSGDA